MRPLNHHEWTPERVRDYVLAFSGTDTELIEVLALATCEVCQERDTFRETVRAAFGHLYDQRAENQRLHQRHITALQDARDLRARGRAA